MLGNPDSVAVDDHPRPSPVREEPLVILKRQEMTSLLFTCCSERTGGLWAGRTLQVERPVVCYLYLGGVPQVGLLSVVFC